MNENPAATSRNPNVPDEQDEELDAKTLRWQRDASRCIVRALVLRIEELEKEVKDIEEGHEHLLRLLG